MRRCRLIHIALLLAPLVALGADNSAEDTFASLYGADYKKALLARDPGEALALANRLLADSKTKGLDPALQALLCQRVYDLGAKDAKGYTLAVEAMQRLVALAPAEQAPALEKVLALRQKQFAAAKGPEQLDAGEALADAALAAADARAAAGPTADAARMLRQVAATPGLRFERKAELQARLDRLTAQDAARKRAAQLQKQLEANPRDPARKDLVKLLVVELDAPGEAAGFVDDSLDEATRRAVPLAAKGVDAADAAACVELGDWYRGLVDGAGVAGKPAMLRRSQQYYERFLTLHPAEDAARAKVSLALEALQAKVPKGPVNEETTLVPGKWVELLRLVDLKRDVVVGKDDKGRDIWKWEGGVLTAGPAPWGRLALPCMPAGSYQLRLVLERTRDLDALALVLPVGARSVGLLFAEKNNAKNDMAPRLTDARVPPTIANALAWANDKDHALDVRVLLADKNARIAVELDGQPYFEWEGPVADLSVAEWLTLKDRHACLGIADYWTVLKLKSVRINMLTGKAQLLK